MAYALSRDPALVNLLQITYGGTVTLQSKDGEIVPVPLTALLGASSLVRGMVADSHLHPGVHGPLILSCEVPADVLVGVGDILRTGEAIVKDNNIIEVKKAMDMLGVAAELSCDRFNFEYNKHIDSDENEAVKLEIVFEMEKEKECYGCDKNATKHRDVFEKNDALSLVPIEFTRTKTSQKERC